MNWSSSKVIEAVSKKWKMILNYLVDEINYLQETVGACYIKRHILSHISLNNICQTTTSFWNEVTPPLNWIIQKQPPKVSLRKGVLRNFAKFTGKHLLQSLEFCGISKNTCFHRTTPLGDCFWQYFICSILFTANEGGPEYYVYFGNYDVKLSWAWKNNFREV